MGLNRYLALKGYATRRAADDLLREGAVTVNGKVAKVADKVNEGDVVEVRRKGRAPRYSYFAYHKPLGVVTHSPQEGERGIREATAQSSLPPGVFPVGRLDKASSGIIILTDDGRVTDRLLSPDRAHEKEYVVKTRERLRESFPRHMAAGVDIGGYVTRPAKVKVTGDKEFVIRLTEGKKHQIRRMVVALHGDVAGLKRTRVMNVRLGSLPPGAHRAIEGEELGEFLRLLGL